ADDWPAEQCLSAVHGSVCRPNPEASRVGVGGTHETPAREDVMRIAIIGQGDFGKAVLEAFLARKDDVAGVFCAPEKAGARIDPVRAAAQERGLEVFQFASLRSPEAHGAIQKLGADLGIMAYVLQFAPDSFVKSPRLGTIQYHPSLLPRYRGPSSIN